MKKTVRASKETPTRKATPFEATGEASTAEEKIENVLSFMRDSPDLNTWIAEMTVKQARQGVTDAARTILGDYVGALEQFSPRSWRGPIEYCYASYLAEAFKKILEGGDAALALGIKTSNPGRRKGTVTHDPDALAAGYYLLVRSGLTKARARSELRTETGADEKTIRNAVKGCEAYEWPQLIDTDLLRSVAKPIAEKISRILARNGKR